MNTPRLIGTLGVLSLVAACSEPPTAPNGVPSLAVADNEGVKCYVVGNPSGNNAKWPAGSKKNPHSSLAAVALDARCKIIEVVHSGVPLDGGITLTEGQTLHGRSGPGGELPVITNTTSDNDGRGVVLADNTTVRGIHVRDTEEAGIYGVDVDGVEIRDNELSGFNAGLHIHPQFLQIGNFRSYFGGIHVEGRSGGRTQRVAIRNNYLHDAPGVGIHVLAVGEAVMRVDLSRNTLRHTGQHPNNPDPFPPNRPQPIPGVSPLGNSAVMVYGFEASTLRVRLDETLVENHGPPLGTGGGAIEFDGLAVFAGGSATLQMVADRYTFLNPEGRGNSFGDQAIHAGVDSEADGASFDLEVTNSHISEPVSSAMALTSYFSMRDVDVRYRIANTLIEGSRVPFASAVTVQHGGFTQWGVPNEGTRLTVEFVDNVVRQRAGPGYRGHGLQVANFAGTIDRLAVLVEGNRFDGMGSLGGGFQVYGNGITVDATVDVGGGALGSSGGNSFTGFAADAIVDGYLVSATHNWWGSPTGPSNIVATGGGAVTYVPFLVADPFQ